MGKLTESLKATTQQLSEIKYGINQMQELGNELADNTLTVAEAGLRTGYAYAKAEEALSQSQLVLPQAEEKIYWTEMLLKERFGSCKNARQYLQETYNVRVKQSWKDVVDAFNYNEGSDRSKSTTKVDRSLSQTVTELQETVALQGQHIAVLEVKLNEAILNLQQLMSVVETLNK